MPKEKEMLKGIQMPTQMRMEIKTSYQGSYSKQSP